MTLRFNIAMAIIFVITFMIGFVCICSEHKKHENDPYILYEGYLKRIEFVHGRRCWCVIVTWVVGNLVMWVVGW